MPRPRSLDWAGLGRLAAMTLLVGLPLTLTWSGSLPADINLYREVARRTCAGQLAYRDFALEYPPVALAFFLLPASFAASSTGYANAFMFWMGLCDGLQRWALARLLPARRQLALMLLWSAASSLLSYTYLKRFDVAAALLCSLALAQLQRRPHGRGAWITLTLAAGCKLYPLVLAPVFWRYSCTQGEARATRLRQLGAAVLTAMAIGLPLYAFAGTQALSWAHYHQARGLHIASHYTGLALLREGLGTRLKTAFAFGAFEVRAPWADGCARAAPWLTLLGLAGVYRCIWRRLHEPGMLWAGCSALIAVLLMASKVVSPQYAAWLVPLVSMAALSAPRPSVAWTYAIGLLVVCVCSAELWPHEHYVAAGVIRKQLILPLRLAALGAIAWRACRRPGPPSIVS